MNSTNPRLRGSPVGVEFRGDTADDLIELSEKASASKSLVTRAALESFFGNPRRFEIIGVMKERQPLERLKRIRESIDEKIKKVEEEIKKAGNE